MLKVGDEVLGKDQGADGGHNWFQGVVRAVHPDGSCDIDYDDGDKEENVAPRFVKSVCDRSK